MQISHYPGVAQSSTSFDSPLRLNRPSSSSFITGAPSPNPCTAVAQHSSPRVTNQEKQTCGTQATSNIKYGVSPDTNSLTRDKTSSELYATSASCKNNRCSDTDHTLRHHLTLSTHDRSSLSRDPMSASSGLVLSFQTHDATTSSCRSSSTHNVAAAPPHRQSQAGCESPSAPSSSSSRDATRASRCVTNSSTSAAVRWSDAATTLPADCKSRRCDSPAEYLNLSDMTTGTQPVGSLVGTLYNTRDAVGDPYGPTTNSEMIQSRLARPNVEPTGPGRGVQNTHPRTLQGYVQCQHQTTPEEIETSATSSLSSTSSSRISLDELDRLRGRDPWQPMREENRDVLQIYTRPQNDYEPSPRKSSVIPPNDSSNSLLPSRGGVAEQRTSGGVDTELQIKTYTCPRCQKCRGKCCVVPPLAASRDGKMTSHDRKMAESLRDTGRRRRVRVDRIQDMCMCVLCLPPCPSGERRSEGSSETDDDVGDNDEQPIVCCCLRWTVVSFLVFSCFPCLAVYWTAKGAVRACRACYRRRLRVRRRRHALHSACQCQTHDDNDVTKTVLSS